MKLSVLHIVGEPVGGIRKHLIDILNGLNSGGNEIHCIYSSINMDSLFSEELKVLEKNGIRTKALHIKKKPSINDTINISRIINYIVLNRIDIVHGHGAKGGVYARLSTLFSQAKSVYTPHGGVAHKMFGKVVGPTYRLIERLLNKFTDFFIFESEYSRDSFLDILGTFKCGQIVNHNGLNFKEVEKLANSTKDLPLQGECRPGINLGIFAMLREQKGQSYAIEAIAQLKRDNRLYKLHLFGDGPDDKNLQYLARNLEVADDIFFYGDVLNVYPYMKKVDVVLIPSLFESFGYVCLEALALDRKIIATRVGGIKEILTEELGCILISPESATELAEAIKNIDHIEIPPRAPYLKNFSIQTMVGKVEKVYLQLAK